MYLFDMDGTLIDSNDVWKDVDREFLARRGLPYAKAYYEGVAHTIFPLAAKFTKEFCNLPDSEEDIMAEWMELAGDISAKNVGKKPGVRAFLEKMRPAGGRLAGVPRAVPGHRRSARGHLQRPPHSDPRSSAEIPGPEKSHRETRAGQLGAVG